MPNLESCLDAVGDALYITVADILSAFWQLPVAEEHVDRTAFVTPSGKYCFKRMPFGVANAPWLFQHVMYLGLGHLGPESGVLSYVDDLICINHTFESHLVSLEKMFAALQAASLTLKPSEIKFGQKEVDYLGHVISANGISISTDRINAILDLPTPKSIKDLRSVLGMANFVRRFVKDYSDRPPAHDSNVEIEPLTLSEHEFLESSGSSVLEKIIVARTLATWYATDGSVAVQISKPSCDGVALPIGLCLGQLLTVSECDA